VGDSITDDLQRWAEMLTHILRLRRPELGVRIVNHGLLPHTTAMVLRRWPATVGATRPDRVLCALGGNDVTRVGPEFGLYQRSAGCGSSRYPCTRSGSRSSRRSGFGGSRAAMKAVEVALLRAEL
jgi:hypothetical protein